MSDLINHIEAVKKFKLGAGQSVPDTKVDPSRAEKITCVRLMIEEVLEMATALGVDILVPSENDGPPKYINGPSNFIYDVVDGANLTEVLDAAVDIMWVGVTGPLVLCGISDKLPTALNAVDQNNLLKLANGHKCPETGKFIKPENRPKVDLKSILDS